MGSRILTWKPALAVVVLLALGLAVLFAVPAGGPRCKVHTDCPVDLYYCSEGRCLGLDGAEEAGPVFSVWYLACVIPPHYLNKMRSLYC